VNTSKGNWFSGRKPGAPGGNEKALGLALALGVAFLVAGAAIQAAGPEDKPVLKPGPISGKTVYLDQARNYPFCEFEVVMGKPPNLTVQIYNTTGQEKCLPDQFDKIDATALAKKLGVVAVVKNPTRFWLMDRLWSYGAGETHDFDGIKATWMAKLVPKGAMLGEHGKPFPPYTPMTPSRHSKYEWLKGSEVYLLRDPNGKVWIMQAYTNLVDKSLTMADLPNLGSKLKLPPGWKYEVKTLDRNLTYVPPAPGYVAHAISDELQNIYQGCGFDKACNYIP
jgi:hypothetical protein